MLILVVGSLYATGRALLVHHRLTGSSRLRQYRREFGTAILIGLDFLTVGLIVNTVMIAPSLAGISALGLVVLIRALISVIVTLESEERWPWQPSTDRDTWASEARKPKAHLPPKLPQSVVDSPSSDN